MRAKHLILAAVLSVTALYAHAQSGDYNEEQGEGSSDPALTFEYEGMTFVQTEGGERNVALVRMEESYLWAAESDPETGEMPEEVDWVIPGSINAADVNVLAGEIEEGATYTVTAIEDCQVVTDYGFIRSVTIPESVTKISSFDFMNPAWGAGVYEAINVEAGNTAYKSVDGLLFTADGKEVLFTPTFDRRTEQIRIELPDGTERIGDRAFENVRMIYTVVVPPSLREIGNGAFSTQLVSIESSDGLAGLESVGAGALAETRWMEEAGEFPMLGSILVGYKGTERNVTIPDGVKKIGDGALALDYNPNMTSIESVKMPEGLTHIGAEAFASNYDMKEITLPESLKEIGEWAFRGCQNLTAIDIPDGVELIGEGAFARCYYVESLTIGSGVDSIGDYAFSEIEMEGVITVEATEPPRCGDNTFGKYTTGYATLVVPAGSEEAYRTARGWKEFESIASGITEQNGLIYALSDDGTAMVKGFAGDEPITDLTIPEKVTYSEKEYTVTEIGVEAFMEMETMRSVTLPGTVEKIGAYAFTMTGISEVALPESLREIGELAFGGTRLRTVEIPAGVEKIGWGALYCEELESVSVAEGNAAYKAVDGVLYTADGLKLMQYPCAKGEKSYTVPEGVEMIMDAAFAGGIEEGKSALEEVTLPQSLRVIGSVAFTYANLREVEIPDGVDSIGDQAFDGCAELEKVTVGKGLRRFGYDVFSYYGDDDDVVGGGEDEPHPDPGMMVMRKIMASGAKTATSTGDKLTTVVWNAVRANDLGVDSYDGPFYGREAITDVTFGEEVEYIPAYMLADQTELKRVRIPASVEKIGRSAFSYCLGLEEIRVEAVEPPLLEDTYDVFYEVDKSIPLIVPEGTVEKYREAEGWREFLNYVEAGDETGVENAEADRPAYYTEGLTLIMDSERDVEVFSTAGTLVYSGRTQTVTLPQAGVYVMRCDGETYKFVVK